MSESSAVFRRPGRVVFNQIAPDAPGLIGKRHKERNVEVLKTLVLCFCFILLLPAGCAQKEYNRKEAEKLIFAGLAYRKKASEGQDPQAALRAMECFSRAVRVDPQYGKAHMERGKQLLLSNLKNSEAEASFLTALDCNPSLLEAKVHLVDALLRQGKRDAAFSYQRELVDEDPSNPMHYNNLGQLYLERKQWGHAVSVYRKALELNPEYVQARQGLGMALLRTGDEAEGISLLREVVSVTPRDVALRCELVRALIAAGLFEEAEKHITIAVTMEPENGLVYHRYAEFLVSHGKLEAARKMAQKALEFGCRLSPGLSEKISGFKK